MPDVSANTHAQILDALESARREVLALRDRTKVKTSYVGFDMTEQTLVHCRAAVEPLRDRDQIVGMLRIAHGSLGLFGGGAVAPLVAQIQGRLQDLWDGMK